MQRPCGCASLSLCFGPLSFLPFFLSAASASLVRWLIISRLVLGDGAQKRELSACWQRHNSSLSFKHRRKGMPMPPPRQALPPVADADTDDDTPPPGENVAIVRG